MTEYKTLWEKEKMLVTSIFSFFFRIVKSQDCVVKGQRYVYLIYLLCKYTWIIALYSMGCH